MKRVVLQAEDQDGAFLKLAEQMASILHIGQDWSARAQGHQSYGVPDKSILVAMQNALEPTTYGSVKIKNGRIKLL